MRHRLAAAVLLAMVTAGAVVAWMAVRSDRAYRRLIARGDASLARSETFLAAEAFSGAIALKPGTMLGYLKRGDAYRRREELAAALRDLRHAAALDPSATKAQELLADVYAAMGRYDRALAHYRAFLAIDDRAPRIRYKLALVHYREGDTRAALDAVRQALALDGQMAEAHYLLGLCLQATDRPRAIEAFGRAVAARPTFGAAREALGETLLAAGRTREGFAELEALSAAEPHSSDRTVALATAYSRAGRVDSGLARLSRALEHRPDDAELHAAVGQQWFDMADGDIPLNKALGALRRAAESPDASSLALTLYGRALDASGHDADALQAFTRATRRFPLDATSFLWQSELFERQARIREARDALLAYASLAGDAAITERHALRLAGLSAGLKEWPTTARWAERVTRATPTHPRALELLAQAHWRSGRAAAARQLLGRALAEHPEDRGLRSLEREMNRPQR